MQATSPDMPRPKGMEAVLLEIDQRPFLNLVAAVAGEVSPSCDITHVRDLMRKAIRCACLLDLFAETRSPEYLGEFVRQRTQFYRMMPSYTHDTLQKLEYDGRQFFEHEQTLRQRIRDHDEFSWSDIEAYMMGKSSDNVFYGKILEFMAPSWTPGHSEALRTQTILFDIGKDIQDYPDDVKGSFPNTLSMALTTHMKPKDIPSSLPEALRAAQETGATEQIVAFASRFYKEIPTEVLFTSPTLREALVQRFESVRRGLQSF